MSEYPLLNNRIPFYWDVPCRNPGCNAGVLKPCDPNDPQRSFVIHPERRDDAEQYLTTVSAPYFEGRHGERNRRRSIQRLHFLYRNQLALDDLNESRDMDEWWHFRRA